MTREGVIDGLQSLSGLDIGTGEPVTYSETNHQASHTVWPTVIRGGAYQTLNWGDL